MGCDIHCYAEIKYKGKWQYAGEIGIKRDYELFAKMANVRNSNEYPIEPITEPKGLPEDISELTRFIMDNLACCDHSHSWFSTEEIKILYEWLETREGALDKHLRHYLFCSEPFSSLIYHQESLPHEIEDMRLVFAFDN